MALMKGTENKRRLLKFHTNSPETNALLFYIGNEVKRTFSADSLLLVVADGDCYHKAKVYNLYLYVRFPFPGVFFLRVLGEESPRAAGKRSGSRVQAVQR